MILVTGDTHGSQEKWMKQIQPILFSNDIVLVCGDFGIGFWDRPNWSEESFYDFLGKQEYIVLFIDGNHENFEKLNSYPVEIWSGGRVHKIRPNLIHLMRGEVYSIEDTTFFVMGGGYSIDKPYRIEGISWWPEEMPSEEEYRRARENLERVNNQVDYIVSHTTPSETVYYLSTIRSTRVKNNVSEEFPLTAFLDEIQRKVSYKHWYFGHFHIDKELWRNQTVVFSMIRELASNKVIRQWDPYEE